MADRLTLEVTDLEHILAFVDYQAEINYLGICVQN